MSRIRLLLAAPLVAAALVPASAHAATVEFSPEGSCPGEDKYMECPGPRLSFTAAAGETNTLELRAGPGRELTLRDARLPLTAPAGCRQLDASAVQCPPADVFLDLGDGDDVADLGSVAAISVLAQDGNDRVIGASGPVRGGDGDDVLEAATAPGPAGATGASLDGGPGTDRLTGGPRNDALGGGSGRDVLTSGDGDDRLSGDGEPSGAVTPTEPADDELDGGAGRDRVDYGERSEALAVSLSTGTGGQSGERDVLRGIEGVEGGSGHDELIGDDGPNSLAGGDGDDRLDALGGDDVLSGGPGQDALLAGAGDDILSPGGLGSGVSRRLSDVALCGAGRDAVQVGRTTIATLIAADCEQVIEPDANARRPAGPVRRTARSISLPISCAGRAVVRGRCRGRVELRAPGGRRVLAARDYAIRRGTQRITVRVRRGTLPRGRLQVRLVQRSRGIALDVRWRIPAAGESTDDLLTSRRR